MKLRETLYLLATVLLLSCGLVQSQLDICSVAETSMIPFYGVNISTNIFNDFYLFGNMCPFGYVKLTDPNTGIFSCKALDEFLLETVDKKSCVIPYDDPFYDPSFPYIDNVNCVLPYLGCSPTTLKCTYIQTRMINDTCNDRMNCYGHITNPFINCYNNKCTYLKENTVLNEGSDCPFSYESDAPSVLDKSMVNYTTNSYDNCDGVTDCQLPSVTSSQKKCLKKVDVMANQTCGVESVQNGTSTTLIYKKCPNGYVCYGTCQYSFTPEPPMNPTGCNKKNVITLGCMNYTSTTCSIYTDCLGNVDSNGTPLKQSLDTEKWPENQPARCDNAKCSRLFGRFNGDSCMDNTDCYSSYCNTSSGTCSNLPETTCGDIFEDPSNPPCPMYSYCGCSMKQKKKTTIYKRKCVDFCMGKLMDLVVCSMNYGMESTIYYQHPLQPVQDKLIPIIDLSSSVISPTNGKCSRPLKKYLKCVYENQKENKLNPRSPSAIINNLTQ